MSLHPETERIHKLETAVVVLEKDSAVQTKILEKLDTTTERLVSITEVLQEKFKYQERVNDDTETLIADRRSEASNAQERIISSLSELKKDLIARIDDAKPETTKSDDKSNFFKVIGNCFNEY